MAVQGLQAQLSKAEHNLSLADDNYRITTEKVVAQNNELRRLQDDGRQKLDRLSHPFIKVQADHAKAKAEFDKARQKFEGAQTEFRKAQEVFDRAEKTFAQAQNKQQQGSDSVNSVVNLAEKRLEREIAFNQREADSWRIKATNARRDVEYFREKLRSAEETERKLNAREKTDAHRAPLSGSRDSNIRYSGSFR